MATANLVGSSADWTAAANWSTAAKPAAGDDVRLLNGSQTFTTNMDDLQSNNVNIASLVFGRDWTGRITVANILKVDTVTKLVVACPRCPELAIEVDTAEVVTTGYVYATGPGSYACYLNATGTGAYTTLYIAGGQSVRLGAGFNSTNTYVGRNAKVWVDSGATPGTLHNWGGSVYSEAAIATINTYGGLFRQLGRATADITTLNVYGGTFKMDCEGATIGTIVVFPGGFLDGTDYSYANTINNVAAGTIHEGGRAWVDAELTTLTNDFNNYNTDGTGYKGPAAGVTQVIPDSPI
jgi:hypothetical protein